MAKSPNIPGSPQPTYVHGINDTRSYPVPTPGVRKPLTFKSANSGNPAYTYVNFASKYLGAFRLPADPGGSGMGTLGWSMGAIAHNPADNTMFVSGKREDANVCQIAIPGTLGTATAQADIWTLPIASVLQPLANMRRGVGADAAGSEIAGLWCDGSKLQVNMFAPYAQDASFKSLFQVVRSLSNLSGSVVDGYMDTAFRASAGGWTSRIPAEYQTPLGGKHLSGFSNSGGNRSSTKSLSMGPAAFASDFDSMLANSATLTGSVIPQLRLCDYIQSDLDDIEEMVPTDQLYNWNGSATIGNDLWTALSEASYGFIVPGTKTYVVFGSQSMHGSGGWYGNNDWQRPAGVAAHPSFVYQGPHPRDPYDCDFWYWMYNVDDLQAVRDGTLLFCDIVPYEWGLLPVAFSAAATAKFIGSGTFKDSDGTLYLTLVFWDNTQGKPVPVVVAYNFGGL